MPLAGNTDNIKKDLLKQIEDLEQIQSPRHLLLSPELAWKLASLTGIINREIAVFIDRQGQVRNVSIGDSHTASLLRQNLRRGEYRLSGVRCIHTHPNGDSTLSQLDLEALQDYKLDAMAALAVAGSKPASFSAAFLRPEQGDGLIPQVYGPYPIGSLEDFPFLQILLEADKAIQRPGGFRTLKERERAILIGLREKNGALLSGEDSLAELAELAKTAGAQVAGCLLINAHKIDPAQYLGKGKAKDLALLRQQEAVDLFILDDELSPRQQYKLQEIIGCRVIDRPALILQIFADRAQTREGKLQVELAQLNYMLPRLTGLGVSLSRLGGGIGTRGPGETKLETDRRHIRRRINELKNEVEEIKKQRSLLRKQRQENQIPVVTMVGYTNAGKSTLMNALTNAGVLAEDKLFATLDPTTRRLALNNGEILLTDTVGFIHKLPPQLTAAFRATLEELRFSDLLLHVVDSSAQALKAHIDTVNQVLEELDLGDKPRIVVFNKFDLVQDPLEFNGMLAAHKPAAAVSALKGTNLDQLLDLVAQNIPNRPEEVSLLIPFEESGLVNLLYRQGQVKETIYTQQGIICTALVKEPLAERLQAYKIIKE